MTRALVRDTVIVSGSRYVILGLGMLRNLWMARLLGPDSYGYWVLFLVVLQYADQVHIGLRHAGDCELPIQRGRGDEQGARHTSNVILTTNMGFAVLAMLLAVAGGVMLLGTETPIRGYDPAMLGTGLIATGIIILTDQFGRFHMMVLRAQKRFMLSSSAETFAELLRTGFVIGLGWIYGLHGGLVAYIIASAAMALYLQFTSDGMYRPHWHAARTRALLGIGFPLFLTSLAGLLIISCDRVVGWLVLRGEAYSLYGFATTIMLLPVFASHGLRDVLFPTFGERFGKGGSPRALYPIYLRALHLVAFATPLLVASVLYGGEFVVRLALPAYASAIPIMEVLSYGITFMSIASLPVAVLMITGRGWLSLALEGFAIVSALACYAALPSLTGPVYALALGTCVLYGVFGMATLVATLRGCELSTAEILTESGFIALPAVAGVVIIAALARIDLPAESSAMWAPMLKALVFVLLYGGVLYLTRGKTDLTNTVRGLRGARTA
jgi:O-antigen/teichoic acid export membrane protein